MGDTEELSVAFSHALLVLVDIQQGILHDIAHQPISVPLRSGLIH